MQRTKPLETKFPSQIAKGIVEDEFYNIELLESCKERVYNFGESLKQSSSFFEILNFIYKIKLQDV